jgi:hypothetical protein
MVYASGGYQSGDAAMPEIGIGKIFIHGRSQAVRLPLAYRLPGDRVRVRRIANARPGCVNGWFLSTCGVRRNS